MTTNACEGRPDSMLRRPAEFGPLTLDAVRPVHHHEGPVVGRAAPFWLALTARRRSGTHARAASKRLSMRRLATLSHTRRGGVSGAQLLALQGHNHTSERVD